MSETGDAPVLKISGASDASPIAMGVLSEQVGFQLHIARRAILLKLRDLVQGEERPLPTGAISILTLVQLNPGLSQQAIADSLALDPSKVTVLMKQLSLAGLISRKRAPADMRRQQLFITEEGEELVSNALAVGDSIEALIERSLGARDRKLLLTLLGRLNDALK